MSFAKDFLRFHKGFVPVNKENPAVPKVLRDLCFIMAKMCDKNTNLTYPNPDKAEPKRSVFLLNTATIFCQKKHEFQN